MLTLLVEDDENKRKRITEFYQSEFPDDNLIFGDAMVTGLRIARAEKPELIILDMTLPNYSNENSNGYNPMRPFGGRDFLRQLSRFGLNTKVVVLTQFESFGSPPDMVDLSVLDNELLTSFPGLYLGAIYYHASKSLWQSQLSDIRKSVQEKDV